MKKVFATVMFALAGITTCLADQTLTYFNIAEKGESSPLLSVPFTQKPVVTYTLDKNTALSYLVVSSDDKAEGVKFDLSKNYDITYTDGETPSAINDALAAKSFSINGNTIVISRLTAGTQVTVCDASGKCLRNATADANGVAVVAMTAMPKGIVIVKAGEDSAWKLKF